MTTEHKNEVTQFERLSKKYEELEKLFQQADNNSINRFKLCLEFYETSVWLLHLYEQARHTEDANICQEQIERIILDIQRLEIKLDVNNYKDLNKVVDTLIHMLSYCTFQTLNITVLDYQITEKVMKAVATHKTLTALTLRGFTPFDIEILGTALSANKLPGLVSLEISSIASPLNEERSSDKKGSSFHSRHPQKVYDEYDSAEKAIIRALEKNNSLVQLTFGDCILNHAGELIGVLKENHTLQELYFWSKTDINPEYLADMLVKNSTLLSVVFFADRFNLDGLEVVAKALETKNQSLEHFFSADGKDNLKGIDRLLQSNKARKEAKETKEIKEIAGAPKDAPEEDSIQPLPIPATPVVGAAPALPLAGAQPRVGAGLPAAGLGLVAGVIFFPPAAPQQRADAAPAVVQAAPSPP